MGELQLPKASACKKSIILICSIGLVTPLS
jgi:hypothetical protein